MNSKHIQTLLFEQTKRASQRSYYDSKIRLVNKFSRSAMSDIPQITPVS